jgi:hypothetical protein
MVEKPRHGSLKPRRGFRLESLPNTRIFKAGVSMRVAAAIACTLVLLMTPIHAQAVRQQSSTTSKGSQVAIAGKCQPWMGSGRGAEDADNIWCQVSYGEHRGWANAYFLAASDGRRLACVMYPTARGCK